MIEDAQGQMSISCPSMILLYMYLSYLSQYPNWSLTGCCSEYTNELTIEPDVHANPYHRDFMQASITRNLGVHFRDLQDEIATNRTPT